MIWVIYFFIISWIATGFLMFLKPKIVKSIVSKFLRQYSFKIWGIIILIISFCFWRSVEIVSVPWLMQVLAITAMIKGLVYFLLPKKKIEGLLNYWLSIPNIIFRILGIMLILLSCYLFQVLI